MKTILLSVVLTMLSVNLWAQDDIERPDSYNYLRGVEEYQEEEYASALEYFGKELDEHPKNGYAYYYISIINDLYGELGEALSAADKAIRYMPTNDNWYVSAAFANRASIYLELEDIVKALADYTMSIKYDPEDTDLLLGRGQIYYKIGDYDRSEADYRKVVELQPGEPHGYIGLGSNLESRGQYEAAISQYGQAIKLDANDYMAYDFRARSYWKMSKYWEGANDLVKAIEITLSEGEDEDNTLLNTILQHAPQEAYPAIIDKLKVQALLHPNKAAAWNRLIGLVYVYDGNFEESITYYKKSLEIQPDDNTMFFISSCYHQLGEYGTAIEYIDRAIEMNPEDYYYLKKKADMEYDAGKIDDAIRDITEYIKEYPDYEGYYYRGLYHADNGDIDEAIADFNTSIAIEQSVLALMQRGRLYLKKGQEEAATADFLQVLLLDTIPEVGSNAQFALFFLGDEDGAKAWMDAILEADNPGWSYYDAACLYSLMGDVNQALSYLSTALQQGYKDFFHISRDPDLDNIRGQLRFKSLVKKYESLTKSATSQAIAQEKGNYIERTEEVPFTISGTAYKVKCHINGLPLHFIFDTGASDVSLSNVEASFMLKNGYINPRDVIGRQNYLTASGEIVEGTVVNLHEVSLGNLSLKDVRASVQYNQKAPLLLGQSVLKRLGKIEIDNSRRVLKITYKEYPSK